jgi:hypothetical protein
MAIYFSKPAGSHSLNIPLIISSNATAIYVTTVFNGLVQSEIDRLMTYSFSSKLLILPYFLTVAGEYKINLRVVYPTYEDVFNDYARIDIIPNATVPVTYSSEYITQADLETYFLINGYGVGSVEHSSLYSPLKIQLHLDGATQLINGFLTASGYSFPIKCADGSIPPIIKQLILDEMDYRLHCTCLDDGRIFKYKQSLSVRDQIRKRTMLITCSNGVSIGTIVEPSKLTVQGTNTLKAFKAANPPTCDDYGGCNGCS